MDKEFIISEIKRTAESNGGVALGRSRFQQETGIREIDWKGIHWINWSDAVKEASVKLNTFAQAMDDQVLLEKAAHLIRELGHFPQIAELTMKRNQDKSFPTEKPYRRFSRKPFFAKAVYEWCIAHDGWEDVAELCKELKDKAVETPSDEPSDAPEDNGYVYLMKSGKYYKIGRTNSLDRRKYEIGMQLPEGIKPIHSIATDDPSGIEAYWHNRFASKRLNGEWFDLSRKDVSTFIKRKFM